MEKKKLTRRERQKLIYREEMLTAALNLFSEKGYHNVSMHEIAEKAEFAIGTLYKFFRNKEDLYKTLITQKAKEYHRVLTKTLEGPEDVMTVLKNYVAVKSEVFAKNISAFRLYFAETQGASFSIQSGPNRDIRKMHEEIVENLAAIFEIGVRQKVFSRLDTRFMAVTLEGISNAFLFRWLENPKRHPYQSNVQKIMDMFLGGCLSK